MLQVFKLYSGFISQKVQAEGPIATKVVVVKRLRSVKKEILRLIDTFVQSSTENEHEMILKNFVPPLMEPVLDDYKKIVPAARDAEVLHLFASLVEKLKHSMLPFMPKVFESIFESTLQMIADFPDHRLGFFQMLRSINQFCFPGAVLFITSFCDSSTC